MHEGLWPPLAAQDWIFVTPANGPPPSDVQVADWFIQDVKNRGGNARSAWVLDVYYVPVGFEPEIPDAPNFQSEKSLWWVDCVEGSSQVRVWNRYKNAF